jgi:predicted nucleic acid-binding protein
LIVVDSSVWIASLQGLQTPQVAQLLHFSARELLIVGDLVMLEVLQGARDEVHAARIERNLRANLAEPMVRGKIASKAAQNYRTMRQRGVTECGTIGLLIGTFCIERGYRLLHDNRAFDAMESLLGLSVIH